MQGLENRPGERTDVGCKEKAWGDGSEELYSQECSWRKPRIWQKWSIIVQWCAAIVASLLTCQSLPPPALGRVLNWAVSSALPSPLPPFLGNLLPLIVTQRAHMFRSLHQHPPARHPACSAHHLGSSSFLPDRLVCSGKLWSRIQWEEHMQRWDWNHS